MLFVVSDGAFTASQRLTITTLQGLASQGGSAIYLLRGSGYNLWLSDLEKRPGLIVARNYQTDFSGLLKHFKSQIKGYTLCDLHSSLSNAAISLSGILGGVAATSDEIARLNDLGLGLLVDVRGKDESWALADYSVFAHAFHFYAPLKSPLFLKALANLSTLFLFRLFGIGRGYFHGGGEARCRWLCQPLARVRDSHFLGGQTQWPSQRSDLQSRV
jgi:hypothetical protein